MKKLIFEGSGVAIVTPFTESGVNYDKLGELLEYQIKEHTDAIIICGTTGESATMSDDEKKQVIKYTVDKVQKRIPVIAGTGSNNTAHAVELSKYAESIGADALLVVTPYYNKTTQKGLIEHYTAISKNVSIQIIAYNVPSRTGLNIAPTTAKELSKLTNLVAIKEASGNISQIAEIAELCKDELYIYSGNDDQIVPIMSLGGKGVISVLANVAPRDTHNMVIEYLNGNTNKALELQLKYLNLVKNLFIEVNPIPVKEALNILGYNVGNCRLPLTTMNTENKEKLERALKEVL